MVALDPPAHAHLSALAERLPGDGWTHLAWGGAELELARRVHGLGARPADPLVDAYRALREARDRAADGAVTGEALAAILRGSGAQPRSGAVAGRLLRVLAELGLVELATAPLAVAVRRLAAAPSSSAPTRSWPMRPACATGSAISPNRCRRKCRDRRQPRQRKPIGRAALSYALSERSHG